MTDKELAILFERRSVVLLMILGGVSTIILARLTQLQVFQHKKYRTIAMNNATRTLPIIPERGKILDTRGVALSDNKPSYRIFIVPSEIRASGATVDGVLEFLTREIKLSTREITRINKQIARQRAFQPTIIRADLDWDKMANLQSAIVDGLYIESDYVRNYPLAGAAAHAIGYVGDVSETDLRKNDDPVLSAPFFKIGKYGLEKKCDLPLRGIAGRERRIVNAVSRVVSSETMQLPRAGENISLYMDARVQGTLAAAIGDRAGAGVVLDLQNGGVMALVSTPSFDPNKFQDDDATDYITSLRKNDDRPFTNKAIEGTYPPGSTFKMVVALAALESGACDPTEKIFCGEKWNYGSHDYHCWKRGGHGSQNLSDALAHSCDIYFYQMALRVGMDAIRGMALRLGLGDWVMGDLDGENRGLIPDRIWKERRLGQTWVHGDTILSGIGQGFVLSTPLQLATMIARLATNKKIVPHLIVGKNTNANPESLGINPENLAIVQTGMERVLREGGTASFAGINVGGARMAGKTGTSQVRGISAAERLTGVRGTDALPHHLRNHGLFVGYAPLDNPRYAISVVLEHAGSASPAAGVAAKTMKFILEDE